MKKTVQTLTENVQACHQIYGNVYEMVIAATNRSRELSQGSAPMVVNNNHKPCVTALLEIEQGKVTSDYFKNR